MAIYDLGSILKKFGDDYLILDYNHLFISSSLQEEIWLLQREDDADLLRELVLEVRNFDLTEVHAERDFDTYSGGQKAILGCVLLMLIIRKKNIRGLKLLLNNIIESLSDENRRALFKKLRQIRSDQDVQCFGHKQGTVEPLRLDA